MGVSWFVSPLFRHGKKPQPGARNETQHRGLSRMKGTYGGIFPSGCQYWFSFVVVVDLTIDGRNSLAKFQTCPRIYWQSNESVSLSTISIDDHSLVHPIFCWSRVPNKTKFMFQFAFTHTLCLFRLICKYVWTLKLYSVSRAQMEWRLMLVYWSPLIVGGPRRFFSIHTFLSFCSTVLVPVSLYVEA